MSSEIEVVEEIESYRKETAKAIEDDLLKNDVYTAATYGDLEKLHRLVEYESCSVSNHDGLSYYVLQWSALNSRNAVAQYIIEHGGDINARDHTGQTALHWSVVRGVVQVAELLLQEDARVDATDMYGYQITNESFLQELPDVRNWFSSYVYKFPLTVFSCRFLKKVNVLRK